MKEPSRPSSLLGERRGGRRSRRESRALLEVFRSRHQSVYLTTENISDICEPSKAADPVAQITQETSSLAALLDCFPRTWLQEIVHSHTSRSFPSTQQRRTQVKACSTPTRSHSGNLRFQRRQKQSCLLTLTPATGQPT